MEPVVRDLPIAALNVSGGTQQRVIEQDVVDRYRELLDDGAIFPPVGVVYDKTTETYWLWEGFHRRSAELRRGSKTIQCSITEGTQKDAVWLSFSANKAHGLPRQPGIVRGIIETILMSPDWSGTPLRAIASHVGVSFQYVNRVKQELSEQRANTGEFTIDGVPEEQTQESEPEPEPAAPAVTVVQIAPAPIAPPEAPPKRDTGIPKDQWGRTIPTAILPVFAQVGEITSLARQITNISTAVKTKTNGDPILWSYLNTNKVFSLLNQAYELVMQARPTIVCPYCGGITSETCTQCKSRGFMSKAQEPVIPAELRPPEAK